MSCKLQTAAEHQVTSSQYLIKRRKQNLVTDFLIVSDSTNSSKPDLLCQNNTCFTVLTSEIYIKDAHKQILQNFFVNISIILNQTLEWIDAVKCEFIIVYRIWTPRFI